MRDSIPELQLAVAAAAPAAIDSLLATAQGDGWVVRVVDDMPRLLELIDSEWCDAALVAAESPRTLNPLDVRELVGHVSQIPVFFALDRDRDIRRYPGLAGLTVSQVWPLGGYPRDLLDAIRTETVRALDSRPEYTVMCVDDDPEFLASLRTLLVPHLQKATRRLTLDLQFHVAPAAALEAARSADTPIAAAICDQKMPEMEGLEVLEKIKRFSPGTERVLLTGYAGLDSAVKAINDQVLDKYLTKPIEEPVDFVSGIRHLIREFHLRFIATTERQRLMSQFEFIRAITLATSLEQAMTVTTRFLHRRIRTAWTAVLRCDEEGLALGGGCGNLPDFASEAGRDFLDELHGATPNLRHLTTSPRTEAVAEDASPFSDIVLLPLLGQTAPLGVILVGGCRHERVFSRDEHLLMTFVADIAAITIGRHNDRQALETHYVGTMASLMDAVEAKDPYTRGHTDRVVDLALTLGRAAGLAGAEVKALEYAASLHDLGKLAVPEGILRKPGRLHPSEFAIIKEHPSRADAILSHLRFLDRERLIIRSHHERYDGTGYPDGLTGEEIPPGGRILAIADAYDAMTSTRPYRQAMTAGAALDEIRAGAGTQFDPRLAALFVELMERSEMPADRQAPRPGTKPSDPHGRQVPPIRQATGR